MYVFYFLFQRYVLINIITVQLNGKPIRITTKDEALQHKAEHGPKNRTESLIEKELMKLNNKKEEESLLYKEYQKEKRLSGACPSPRSPRFRSFSAKFDKAIGNNDNGNKPKRRRVQSARFDRPTRKKSALEFILDHTGTIEGDKLFGKTLSSFAAGLAKYMKKSQQQKKRFMQSKTKRLSQNDIASLFTLCGGNIELIKSIMLEHDIKVIDEIQLAKIKNILKEEQQPHQKPAWKDRVWLYENIQRPLQFRKHQKALNISRGNKWKHSKIARRLAYDTGKFVCYFFNFFYKPNCFVFSSRKKGT